MKTKRSITSFLVIIGVLFFILHPVQGAELKIDAATIFLAHFNGTVTAETGQTPVTSDNITYESGIFGGGLAESPSMRLIYDPPAGYNPAAGTVEFWIRPRWINRPFYSMQIFNLALGIEEVRVQINTPGGMMFLMKKHDHENNYILTTGWSETDWHHVAVTWSIPGRQIMYVDGVRISDMIADEKDFLQPDRLIIGALLTSENAYAVLDEFRISNRARTPAEIAQTFLASEVTVSVLSAKIDHVSLYPTWTYEMKLQAETSFGKLGFPNAACRWTSDDASIVTVDSIGILHPAASTGITNIRGRYGDLEVVVQAQQHEIFHQLEHIPVADHFATPAAGCLYEVPVLLIEFLPLVDAQSVIRPNGTTMSLGDLTNRNNAMTERAKFMLEEGSRYHGYKDPEARPSLGYRIIDRLRIYEHMPQSNLMCGWNPTFNFPDYFALFERINAQHYVDVLGVKEIWIWYTIHHLNGAGYELPESNMSNAITGDISNGRVPYDLPVYQNGFTVYQYNDEALHTNAVHNHGHQLEAQFLHAAWVQDGNEFLFWDFMGIDHQTASRYTGRCGWTHSPPNTLVEYYYSDTTRVESNIEDWHPDGSGEKKFVNVDTWNSIPYEWPDTYEAGIPPGTSYSLDNTGARHEAQWYIYWMQNMPGKGAAIEFERGTIGNWWELIADWDGCARKGLGLYTPAEPTSVTSGSAPGCFRMYQNTPNPFNPTTAIRYELPMTSWVTLTIYNSNGQVIERLVDQWQASGSHAVAWHATDVSAGVYFYRIEAGEFCQVRKCVLIK